INSSWAIASGYWVGQGAAAFRWYSVPLGQAGLRPRHPNRDGQDLAQCLGRLDSLWRAAVSQLGTTGPARLRHRETAAVLAPARFTLTGAPTRRESRGMHRRTAYPAEAYALTGPDNIRIELTLEPLQEKAL
ncbi:MAG: hypothetical protein H7317_02810, partial [Pseudorhodobacter sp.]|nr:hypothetical protein [Pseudorhodobacter sp.]